MDDTHSEQGSRRSRKASEGTEHLQAAARELIAAARAFLDAAEDAIEDSGVVEEVGAVLRDLGRRTTAATSPHERDDPPGDAGDGGSDDAADGRSASDRRPRPRVRRIDVE